jgi:hypothetical protein
VEYPSSIGAIHGMWSGDVYLFRSLYVFGSLVGVVAFLSGFVGLLAIAVRAVNAPSGPEPRSGGWRSAPASANRILFSSCFVLYDQAQAK